MLIHSCRGLQWEQELTAEGHGELSGMTEVFYYMTVMVAAQLHKFPKNHQTVDLQWVNFMLCKLYLNKAPKKILGRLSRVTTFIVCICNPIFLVLRMAL